MSPRPDPPAALMAFAEELRAHRALAGMSRDDLAAKVSYSSSLIAMIETCRRSPSRKLAELIDVVFSLPGTFARLEKRLRDVPFPASFRPFVQHEAEASSLRWYELSLVPGLLQTADYARAVLSTRVGATEDEIDQAVSGRMERQAILHRDDPPLLWAVVDEAVVRRPVGGSDVMHAQVEHLAEMAERTNVVVQVIPHSTGAHEGLAGAFVIADFATAPSIVYLETALTGLVVERPEDVSAVTLRYETLKTEALPRAASLELLREVAKTWT